MGKVEPLASPLSLPPRGQALLHYIVERGNDLIIVWQEETCGFGEPKGLEEAFESLKALDTGEDLLRKDVSVAMFLVGHMGWVTGELHKPGLGCMPVDAGKGLYFFE